MKAIQFTHFGAPDVLEPIEGTVLPRTPRRDFAGIVIDGSNDWVGAEVFSTGGDIGFTRDGSRAEAILLPATALVRKPANLDRREPRQASPAARVLSAYIPSNDGALDAVREHGRASRPGRRNRVYRKRRVCRFHTLEG